MKIEFKKEYVKPDPLTILVGKKYKNRDGAIVTCILKDIFRAEFKTESACYTTWTSGLMYGRSDIPSGQDIVSEYVEPEKITGFDWTKPAQTKGGKKVLGLTLLDFPAKYNLIGYIEGDEVPCFWKKDGTNASYMGCYNMENILEKKVVPLEPSDIKFGDFIRHCEEEEGCWRNIEGIKKNKSGDYVVLYSGGSVELHILKYWLISRDGGKTWQRCEKEVVS
jgi:hypothetical protein